MSLVAGNVGVKTQLPDGVQVDVVASLSTSQTIFQNQLTRHPCQCNKSFSYIN